MGGVAGVAGVDLDVLVAFKANHRLPRMLVNVISAAVMATLFELGFCVSSAPSMVATLCGATPIAPRTSATKCITVGTNGTKLSPGTMSMAAAMTGNTTI